MDIPSISRGRKKVKMVDAMVKMVNDKGETSVRILDPCKMALVVGIHDGGKVQRIAMGDQAAPNEVIKAMTLSTVDTLISMSGDSSEKRAKFLAAYMEMFVSVAAEMAGTAVLECVKGC